MRSTSPRARVALMALALLASLLVSVLLLALVFGSLVPALYAALIVAPPLLPVAALALYWGYHLPGRPRSIPPSHHRAILTYGGIIGVSMLPYAAAHFWVRSGTPLPAVLALIAYAGLNLWAALIFSRSLVITYLAPDVEGDGVTEGDSHARGRTRRLYLSWLILVPTWAALFLLYRGRELIGGIMLALAMVPLALLWRDLISSARHKP